MVDIWTSCKFILSFNHGANISFDADSFSNQAGNRNSENDDDYSCNQDRNPPPDSDCLIIEDSSIMDAPRKATKKVLLLRLRMDDHPAMKKKFFVLKRYLKIHLGRNRYISTSTFNEGYIFAYWMGIFPRRKVLLSDCVSRIIW